MKEKKWECISFQIYFRIYEKRFKLDFKVKWNNEKAKV